MSGNRQELQLNEVYQETRSCLSAKCKRDRVYIREPASSEHLRLLNLNNGCIN